MVRPRSEDGASTYTDMRESEVEALRREIRRHQTRIEELEKQLEHETKKDERRLRSVK